MADKIIHIAREDNSDATVGCWHVQYRVEDSGNTNEFVVVVYASEMTDSTSEAEAKTLGNAKALTIKDDWIADQTTATSITDTTTAEEDVTLA